MKRDCLFFVQAQRRILVIVEAYDDPIDALQAMRDCERAFRLPVVGVINSFLTRDLGDVEARVVVEDISAAAAPPPV